MGKQIALNVSSRVLVVWLFWLSILLIAGSLDSKFLHWTIWANFTLLAICCAMLAVLISRLEDYSSAMPLKIFLFVISFILYAAILKIFIVSFSLFRRGPLAYVPYDFYILKELLSSSLITYFFLYVIFNSHSKALIYSLPVLLFFLITFNPKPTTMQEAAIFKSSFSNVFVKLRIFLLLLIAYRTIVWEKPLDRTVALVLIGYFIMLSVSYLSSVQLPIFDFAWNKAFFPIRSGVYIFWVIALWIRLQEVRRSALQSIV